MTTHNINSALPTPTISGDKAPIVTVAKSKPMQEEKSKVTSKDQSTPTPEHLQRMIEKANKAMDKVSSNLEFKVDDSTNKTVVKVTESQTGKLIMQFPSEEMLSITRAIDHAQNGLLLKAKA